MSILIKNVITLLKWFPNATALLQGFHPTGVAGRQKIGVFFLHLSPLLLLVIFLMRPRTTHLHSQIMTEQIESAVQVKFVSTSDTIINQNEKIVSNGIGPNI